MQALLALVIVPKARKACSKQAHPCHSQLQAKLQVWSFFYFFLAGFSSAAIRDRCTGCRIIPLEASLPAIACLTR